MDIIYRKFKRKRHKIYETYNVLQYFKLPIKNFNSNKHARFARAMSSKISKSLNKTLENTCYRRAGERNGWKGK